MLRSLRTRFLAVFLVPTLALFGLAGASAYGVAKQALEDELGRSLALQAAAVASQLAPERALMLAPGDEGTRTFRNLSRTLEEIRASTDARRIFVFDTQGRALLDSARGLPIGTEVPELGRDRLELQAVFSGGRGASAVLFEGSDKKLYKTGYAPLLKDGQVVGAVGVEGTAAFFSPLARLTRAFLGWLAASLVVLALLALWTARGLSRPLQRLMKSALRIGAGDLSTRVPPERTREIGVLAHELESMRQALEARERQLRMMLAGVAHEVRNPLGGMELFLGLLSESLQAPQGPPPEEARGHVARLSSELTYLKRIVEDFLSFAREQKLAREPLEVRPLLKAASDMVAPEAQRKALRLQVSAEEARLSGDFHLLLSAVVNLAKNAVQAAPQGGEVRVEGFVRDGAYCVDVTDDGPGVGKEGEERIFEPFFTTREKGTGLGLPLARKIARAHGGELTLDAPAGPTRFRLKLPLQP